MKVKNKTYSDISVMMIPNTILIKAVDLLCFRTLSPLTIKTIPPITNINSTSKIGHFTSIILSIISILHLLGNLTKHSLKMLKAYILKIKSFYINRLQVDPICR